MAGGILPAGMRPSGGLSQYTPTLREKFISKLAKGWFGDTRRGYEQAQRVATVADYTPAGTAMSLYDAGRQFGQGNKTQAGIMAAMSGLPIPGAIKKDVVKGIRAYHGSPHNFDKFDMSKIGSGEGAQAYGHGLYFAEGEGVAKAYKENVKDMGAVAKVNARMSELARIMHTDEAGGYRKFKTDNGRQAAAEYDALMEQRSAISNAPGHMYEVNIDADPEQFLDWDKPLSEQPESAREILNKSGVAPTADVGSAISYAKSMRNPLEDQLKQAGIPGIKYLDAGSRPRGNGLMQQRAEEVLKNNGGDVLKSKKWIQEAIDNTSGGDKDFWSRIHDDFENMAGLKQSRNYVVFDDKLVKIMRKYGLGGLIGIGAGANAMQQPEPDRRY